MVFILVTEVLKGGENRVRCGAAQSTERCLGHEFGKLLETFEVPRLPFNPRCFIQSLDARP
jgi:hypothetical protein